MRMYVCTVITGYSAYEYIMITLEAIHSRSMPFGALSPPFRGWGTNWWEWSLLRYPQTPIQFDNL